MCYRAHRGRADRDLPHPIEGISEQGPDYRVYACAAEIGAGWKRAGAAGDEFMSRKPDDPAFANLTSASLFPADDGSGQLRPDARGPQRKLPGLCRRGAAEETDASL